MPTKADKEKTFNLSNLNLNYVNLVKELNALLEKPNPKLLIQKWWKSKHIPYDQQRLDHIITYVEKINLANDSILNLQSKLAVNQQVLEMMIGGQLAQAERMAQLQLAQHQNELQKVADEKKGRQLQLEALEIANLKARAEINQTLANANLTSLQGVLVKKIIDELDLNNISANQALILIKSLDTKASAEVNVLTDGALLDQVLEQAKAETRKRRIENDRLQAQADIDRATADNSVVNIKKI